MRPRRITWVVPAGVGNSICTSQTPGAAGALTLNGTTVTAGVANLQGTMPNVSTYADGVTSPAQRRVTITSAGADSGRTFTVKGYAAPFGSGDTNFNTAPRLIVETLAGPGTGLTVTTVNDFAQVIEVDVDAATAGAITVGTSDTASTPWQQPDPDLREGPFAVGFGATLRSGSVTYHIEHTISRLQPNLDWQGGPKNKQGTFANVFPHSSLGTDQTASHDGNYAFPITGFRLVRTANTGTMDFEWIQQGVVGGGSP